MTKTPLIINGAARPDGNTDRLLERVPAGAKNVNLAPPRVVELRNKRISNCIVCYRCPESSECSLRDDMTEIRALVENTDIMVFASPLYWCGVTGPMKTFIDRLCFYYHPGTKPRIAGKKVVILTPMNQKNIEFESRVLVEFYKGLFGCLCLYIVAMPLFNEIMGKADLWTRPEYLERACQIGARLGKYTIADARRTQKTGAIPI